MNRNLIWLWGMLMLVSAVFTACNNDDTLTADPNSEWALKNSAYLDSIAAVAANPPAGERWEKYLSYKLQNDTEEASRLLRGARTIMSMRKCCLICPTRLKVNSRRRERLLCLLTP